MVATPVQQSTKSAEVKAQLLDAAEKHFAIEGYNGASVREITKDAECNVAAVNYHFGGKEKLYEEVLRRRMTYLTNYRMPAIEAGLAAENTSAEKVIRIFCQVFVNPILKEEEGQYTLLLLNREFLEPKLPSGMMAEEFFPPYINITMKMFKQFWPNITPERSMQCMFSIVGQLVHMLNTQACFEREGYEAPGMSNHDEMIDHIVQFSLAAVIALEGEAKA